MPDEFHDDETLLTSYETLFFSLLATSAKVVIFNVMKLSIKFSLRLALLVYLRSHAFVSAGVCTYIPGRHQDSLLSGLLTLALEILYEAK